MHFSMDDGGSPQRALTIVAIDKDKNSQQAVKWTVDNLLTKSPLLILVHVRTTNNPNNGYVINDVSAELNNDDQESELSEIFIPYRGFCARKGMQLKEVVLESADVSKALIEYINMNRIRNVVVGASNRNILRKLRGPDVPTSLTKMAPDFCSVYVIYKTKIITARPAKGPANGPPSSSSLPPRQSPAVSPRSDSLEDSVRSAYSKSSGSWRGGPVPPSPMKYDNRMMQPAYLMSPARPLSGARTAPSNALYDYVETSNSIGRPASSRETSFSDDDLHSSSMDFGSSMDFASSMDSSSMSSDGSGAANARDVEAEMRRLRLELKQTMEMYSRACQEAITAKQRAQELHQAKDEESRKVEELRQSEESALEMVKMEKAKCKAAIEAAEAAQRIAELEAQKRLKAEMKARKEAEERRRTLNALNNVDLRYRKYSIEDIEIATGRFTDELKIGEGGYGPVYKAMLDHTPVAIKVLRPDAQQGRKQFQQEVEVLSCMRHPNMVLLLGACPEYGCLVYEYMDYGSLEDRLFRRGDTPPLSWAVRFKIAAEIATGLLFLHQAKPEPLVHRDLKPANILLNHNFVAKIADVGLARLVPPSVADTVTQYRMTSTAGTFCYIDPEYQQTGMLGTKSDIYSFGVMLLQIITARPPMGLSHHVERAIERGNFKEILDPAVNDWPIEESLSFARIALKCMELRRKDRPDLATIVLPELHRLREFAELCE